MKVKGSLGVKAMSQKVAGSGEWEKQVRGGDWRGDGEQLSSLALCLGGKRRLSPFSFSLLPLGLLLSSPFSLFFLRPPPPCSSPSHF